MNIQRKKKLPCVEKSENLQEQKVFGLYFERLNRFTDVLMEKGKNI